MKKVLFILFMLFVVYSGASAATKCKAITHAGTRCSRSAKIAGYCSQHYNIKKQEKNVVDYDNRVKENYDNNGKPVKASNDTDRCKAITKKGTRCKLRIIRGSKYCPIHNK